MQPKSLREGHIRIRGYETRQVRAMLSSPAVSHCCTIGKIWKTYLNHESAQHHHNGTFISERAAMGAAVGYVRDSERRSLAKKQKIRCSDPIPKFPLHSDSPRAAAVSGSKRGRKPKVKRGRPAGVKQGD